jgi:heme O synthase-like polyprenyltransferase
MMIVSFIINIFGITSLVIIAPKKKADGLNVEVSILFVYLGYLTIKFIYGLVLNSKHLKQGLQVIASTNEVFVAKRVLIFSLIHLIVLLVIAIIVSASVW